MPDRPSRGERRLPILAEDYHEGSQGGRSVSGFSETEKRTGKDGKQRKLPEPTKPQGASSARRLPRACCSARPPAAVRAGMLAVPLAARRSGISQIGVTTSGDGGMTLSNTASTPRTKVQA